MTNRPAARCLLAGSNISPLRRWSGRPAPCGPAALRARWPLLYAAVQAEPYSCLHGAAEVSASSTADC